MASWMVPTITSDSTWQHGAHEAAKLSKNRMAGTSFWKKNWTFDRVWVNVPVPWMVLLMVQKSGEKTTWDGAETLQNHGQKLPTSTGAGFRPPTVWVNYPKLKLKANTAPDFFFEIHRLIHGGFSSLSCWWSKFSWNHFACDFFKVPWCSTWVFAVPLAKMQRYITIVTICTPGTWNIHVQTLVSNWMMKQIFTWGMVSN